MTLPPPAEWDHHEAVWIGFPSHAELWEQDLEPARAEVAAFVRAVHAGGRGERVLLVAADEAAAMAARALVGDAAQVVVERFGDIWLRDTAAIVTGDGVARDFAFNGWGGKYELEGDDDVGRRLAKREHLKLASCDWVLEGGALDGDGTGVVLTTEQCLLNPNRNPGFSRLEVERRLLDDLGFHEVLWLGDGLAHDHTDGHVDNLARLVAPGRVAVPQGTNDDPNQTVYERAAQVVADAGLEVVRVPSPGRILRDAKIVPASYMNFYIGNAAVVVPLYGAENDAAAVTAIGALFPDRETVGLRADAILTGGGSFHCISQQIPGDVRTG